MVDLLILGAGPAGCAAAIRARQAGLRVMIVEAQAIPRRTPGETLHPGVEPILAQLGVREAVLAAGFHRHRGVWLEAHGVRWFEAYGEDGSGAWLGFQADRERLHGILLNAALDAGTVVIRPAVATDVLREGARVAGLFVERRAYRARWVADATGRTAWLARPLQLEPEWHSPPMRVRFGWRELGDSDLDGQPLFRAHEHGWDWHAPLDSDRLAWATLRVAPPAPERAAGMELAWRLYRACAGPGYAMLGDAAALLDPSSASGVLRALMSGVFLSHLLEGVVQHSITDDEAMRAYRRWTHDLFAHHTRKLRQLYAEYWPSASI